MWRPDSRRKDMEIGAKVFWLYGNNMVDNIRWQYGAQQTRGGALARGLGIGSEEGRGSLEQRDLRARQEWSHSSEMKP